MNTLDQILQKLAEKIPLHSVYAFQYSFLDSVTQHLLIVLDSKCQITTKALEPIAELCLAETPTHTFELIPYGELKTALNNGSLYYVLAQQKEHLRFWQGTKALPSCSRKTIESILVKAREHYEKGRSKQNDFLEGMEFYRKKNNLPQALFMLHQAVELTFRSFEHAIFKRDRPSHNLQEHIRLIGRYIPEITKLFPKEDDPYAYRLLKLIDQAYTAVRYEREFEVELEELDSLLQKFLPLLTWCNTYYNYAMEALEKIKAAILEQPIPSASTTPSVVPDDFKIPADFLDNLNNEQRQALLQLLVQLPSKQSIQRVILLGYDCGQKRKVNLYTEEVDQSAIHCYILAITESGNANKSHSFTQNGLRITLLLATSQQLTQALEKRKPFFTQALNKAYTIFCTENSPIEVPDSPDWEAHLTKAQTVWGYRKRRAETFLQCAYTAFDEQHDELITAFLCNQTLEQACIGLLYSHFGLRVDQCNLPFLFALCDMISPDLRSCFSGKDSFGELQQLKYLSDLINTLRYRKERLLTKLDVDKLLSQTQNFLTHANKLCQEAFVRLQEMIAKDKQSITKSSEQQPLEINIES